MLPRIVLACVVLWTASGMSIMLSVAWLIHNAKVPAEVSSPLNETASEVKALIRESRALVKTVKDGYDDTYYDQKSAIESTAALVREAHESLRVMTVEASATMRASKDTLDALKSLLATSEREMQASSADARKLIPAVDAVLNNIATLTATADTQLNKGGPEAVKTLLALNKAVDDLDKLVADPNNAKVLANVEGITQSLEESAKSVDAVLRPLREKAGILKTILKYALGVFKVTIPL